MNEQVDLNNRDAAGEALAKADAQWLALRAAGDFEGAERQENAFRKLLAEARAAEPAPAWAAEIEAGNLDKAFMESGEFSPARLEAAVASWEKHPVLRSSYRTCSLAALATLAGRADLLRRVAACQKLDLARCGKKPVPKGWKGDDERARRAAVPICEGFFGPPRTKLPVGIGSLSNWHSGHAIFALGALLCARFPPGPKEFVERALGAGSSVAHDPSRGMASVLFEELDERLHDNGGFGGGFSEGDGNMEAGRLPATPLEWLGLALSHALSRDPSRLMEFPEAAQALAAAEKAAADGLRWLAAQLGALLTLYPEVTERAAALAADAPKGEPLLWEPTEAAKPSDLPLLRLSAALAPTLNLLSPAKKAPAKKSTAKGAAGAKSLCICLQLVPVDGAVNPTRCSTVGNAGFRLLALRADGTVSRVGKALSWNELKEALDNGALVQSESTVQSIKGWLAGCREESEMSYHASASGHGLRRLLDAALGSDVAWRVQLSRDEKDVVDDPEIEKREICLATRYGKDGSLAITLPDVARLAGLECHSWRGKVTAERASSNVFERTGPRSFAWWRTAPSIEPFFNELLDPEHPGRVGEIVVPKAGVEKARAMLVEAGAALPLEGAVTGAGDTASLRHVAGAARLVVRLELVADGLSARLFARPCAEKPALLFEPGRGRAEIVVPDAKGRKPFVVARDLAAEQAAAAAVRDALADFDAEAEGEDAWLAGEPLRRLMILDAFRALAADPERGPALEWRGAKRIAVRKAETAALLGDGGAGHDWFGVQGTYRLDDGAEVALAELLAALPHREGGFVPLDDGSYVRLSAAMRRELEALAAAGTVRDGRLCVSPAAVPMLGEAFAGAGEGAPALPKALAEAAERFRAALAEPHPVPEGLAARLRPYQLEGYEWLARLAACGLGACLADDMGLGKTVQILAVLLERAAAGPSLVVAPASVCGNWAAEIARFAPGLAVVPAAEGSTLPETLRGGQVVVASYGMLVSREEQFAGREWNGVVLDEAQAIKNADVKRAKAAKRLRAAWRVAATGTPVENRLLDLWSLFDFLDPGLLGPDGAFAARFTDASGRPTAALRNLVRPFLLRRLKGEVLRDLPEKTEITLSVDLGGAERAAYEALRREALASFTGNAVKDRFKILAALTRLRRFCCVPELAVPGMEGGAKMDALEELLEGLREGGHRALVFSQFTDVLSRVKSILARRGWGCEYLDGSTPNKERQGIVDAFQNGTAPFFLISLKAGGTGLNLTAANYVVLLDPWWNPAVEDQAADRAHRIGQKLPVTVYRLVAKDTVEEKVLALHGDKRELSAAVLEGTDVPASLTPEALLGLFKEGSIP